MIRSLRAALLTLCISFASTAPAMPSSGKPDAKTEAAVVAVDQAWGRAEADGDTAFVEQLLMPDYRSVGADGKTTDRDAIIASTRQHAGSRSYMEQVETWRRRHPSHGEVALFGDTAILRWVSDLPGSSGTIRSCDIFIYRSGHWRAIYSQHIA